MIATTSHDMKRVSAKGYEVAPRYRISAKREGAHLPHFQLFAWTRKERGGVVERIFEAYPHDIIEVRLLKGFRHNYPVRWRVHKEGDGFVLEVVSRYSQLAIGKRPPSAKQRNDQGRDDI